MEESEDLIFNFFFNISLSRTTINFYLVNLSIADLLISAWCPWTSLIQQVIRGIHGGGYREIQGIHGIQGDVPDLVSIYLI